jgi:hypothetical protein
MSNERLAVSSLGEVQNRMICLLNNRNPDG